ncbi:MAG: hypothetical protein J5761_03380 [Paludibacteraceae bacterium]|nr:hypothetical protein [Paludibacteraceae bacterium]
MRKSIILAIALMVSAVVFAQEKAERDMRVMKGLSWGIGLPIECRDLPGMGLTANIGYDATWAVNDRLAMGFYLTGGGGFWGEFKQYSTVDHFHPVFRLTAGLLMQIGDLENKPWLVGVAPCTGFGLYDLDMTLPVEVRFGKFLTDRWYIMGELTYHASLAKETACIEPAIRVGYNFGRKK